MGGETEPGSVGRFHRDTAVNRPSIDGIGLKAAIAPEELQVERFRVTVDPLGKVHMRIPVHITIPSI